jgi:hypothetical protein
MITPGTARRGRGFLRPDGGPPLRDRLASSPTARRQPGFSFPSGAGQFLVKDLGVRRLSFLHVKMLGLDG